MHNPEAYSEIQVSTMPRARQNDIVITELPDETLVYDLTTHKAHNLNRTAALVWRHCDGRTPVPGLAAMLARELGAPKDEAMVWLSLRQLDRAQLLEEALPALADTAPVSRRHLLRNTAISSAILLPVVASIVAPTAHASASKP